MDPQSLHLQQSLEIVVVRNIDDLELSPVRRESGSHLAADVLDRVGQSSRPPEHLQEAPRGSLASTLLRARLVGVRLKAELANMNSARTAGLLASSAVSNSELEADLLALSRGEELALEVLARMRS